jgi:hypothetical protein
MSTRGTLPEFIGCSEEGRPLSLLCAGAVDAPMRVMIVAGQHGDEGRSRRAVEKFIEVYRNAPAPRVALAVVPNLNPDGAVRKQRANARGIDLNRDHQLLAAAETRALHNFVCLWRPHFVIDVHTYPPRRKHLLAHNLIHCHDVFLDVPNNPSQAFATCAGELPHTLQTMCAELTARGYRSGRYVLVTESGKVRYSSPDVVDARNSLALRYGIPTLLIEGRKPTRADGSAERKHLRAGLLAALEIAVQWAEQHEALTSPAASDATERVAIRARRVRSESPCLMPFQDARTGDIHEVEMPGVFAPGLKITRRVSLPAAYAVPRTHAIVIDVLHRHGFASDARPDAIAAVERDRFRMLPRLGRRPRLVAEPVIERSSLADYLLFPVTPPGGHALAVHLEPRSKYGLHRYAEMNLHPRPDSFYPVLRVPG